MWNGFERFVIDRDVRVVAVDQGSELRYTLQVGGVALATQEQLTASLHDAVALAGPDRVHALDVLHAEDDCDVVSPYHGSWNVEASFAISKRDVSARPIFHHARNGTWAHLTVVVAAVAVARHLQKTAGIGVARIMRELCSLQENNTMSLNSRHLTAADPLIPPTVEAILVALNISTEYLRPRKSV